MMQLPEHGHDPVLLDLILEVLRPASASVLVDCTLGRAGHALAAAALMGAGATLVGLDADPANLEYSRTRLASSSCRISLHHANFADLNLVLDSLEIDGVNAIMADLGLSTNQFLDPAYGLSFTIDAPLNMRINPRTRTSAADIVNRTSERELADLIFGLSDERFSRRIARKIVEARQIRPIKSTGELAELVRSAIPRRGAGGADTRIDPATRTFMALRMKVNGEMENLARLMQIAPAKLKPGGRIAVISFQSMEDRVVKQAFRSAEQTGLLKVVTKKPLSPSDIEIAKNPRARSAKLRVAERTELPVLG